MPGRSKFFKPMLSVDHLLGLDLAKIAPSIQTGATITGRGYANSGPVLWRRDSGAYGDISIRDHANRRGPRRPNWTVPASVCIGALIRRERRHRWKLPVSLYAGAGFGPARTHLRHGARAPWISRRVDARSQRTARDQPARHAGPLEHLSGFGAALDQSARWPVAQDDLHAGPRTQRHRAQLRSQSAQSDALSASAGATAGALPVRKRLRRRPLAPSPHRRGCRSLRIARQIVPWRRPSPRLRRSQDNPAPSLPGPQVRDARETSARRDESRRMTMHAAIVATAVQAPADRTPCPASAMSRPQRPSSAEPSA